MTTFFLAWTYCLTVATLDMYLNIRYPVLTAEEMNPLARAILYASDGDVALLLACKFFANVVLFTALAVGRYRPMARVGAAVLTVAQTAVLYFLTDCFSYWT